MKKYWFIVVLFALTSCAAESASQMSYRQGEDLKSVMNKIESQFLKWKGTRYRYGGTTHRGIDCSAFISMTAQDQFNLKLPRTVAEQAKIGHQISKREARPGDLVFFKTGRRQLHVGIYYKDNHFLHVSSKKGVIFSSLENPYWKSKYWQTRRLM